MKVADSYQSIIRGVSEQVPHSRAQGQHAEQVNMLSDPVNGLVRRHGSILQAEALIAGAAPVAANDTDTAGWASLDYTANNVEYTLLYRRAAKPAGSTLPPFQLYNKTGRAFLPVAKAPSDTAADTLANVGVAAITAVGRYLFLAGNGVTVGSSTLDLWGSPANQRLAVAWVRGGAYSRTFKLTAIKADGTRVPVTYATPSASYQGVLTTTDIAATDPEYTKKVNDRVNAYNSAVTAWIGTASAAVQPAAIAAQIAALLNTAGVACTVVGSHICFTPAANVVTLEADDGGDGSLFRAVDSEIDSADRTSVIHWPGKVVKVKNRSSAEAYYLKAIAKDPAITTAYTEVTWVEGAGVRSTISSGLFYATVSGGTLYYASSAAFLTSLVGGTHPSFEQSTVGDLDTSPLPAFAGKPITYLGTFQSRLLVGSGGVLSVSKTGDFLNFFRSTVLTLPADGPFDLTPQASEDDEFQQSVMYDQDLVIFGNKRQYVIPGNVVMAPTSAQMAVLANYEGVADVPPVAAGGFIFYAKRGTSSTSIHQIQPGQNDNSPESFPASSQLDGYIAGGVVDMATLTGSPSMLVLRTTGLRNSLYTFTYLDRQDGRKMDSWARWDFAPTAGAVVGMSTGTDSVLVFTTRTNGSGQVYIVADSVPTSARLSDYPYLDSLRLYTAPAASSTGATANLMVAFDSTSTRHLRGGLYSVAGSLGSTSGLWAGFQSPAARVTVTNPFMRDKQDRAILSGRLTVTKKVVAFKDSTGFAWSLQYRDQPATEHEFNGRYLGSLADLIGREPVVTGQYSVPVGREVRDYTLTLKARRWYPLTITALEWSGQYFNRTQRF